MNTKPYRTQDAKILAEIYRDAVRHTGAQIYKQATFAAGCFWGVESIFRGARGIIDTYVGYTGGHYKNPTYEDVSTDTTGHAEAARIHFDPEILSYEDLLRMLFKSHNPTIMPGEKHKYRSTVFYHSKSQRATAEAFLEALQSCYERTIQTKVVKASKFYLAEERHQHYYEKHPPRQF